MEFDLRVWHLRKGHGKVVTFVIASNYDLFLLDRKWKLFQLGVLDLENRSIKAVVVLDRQSTVASGRGQDSLQNGEQCGHMKYGRPSCLSAS